MKSMVDSSVKSRAALWMVFLVAGVALANASNAMARWGGGGGFQGGGSDGFDRGSFGSAGRRH